MSVNEYCKYQWYIRFGNIGYELIRNKNSLQYVIASCFYSKNCFAGNSLA